mmetsp:Transcript_5681/g.17547  ORF Transcript_5681/g.17547 Transcript_5681/m.17547 type:complete len:246 (-) Transcript_5681:12-749(-)
MSPTPSLSVLWKPAREPARCMKRSLASLRGMVATCCTHRSTSRSWLAAPTWLATSRCSSGVGQARKSTEMSSSERPAEKSPRRSASQSAAKGTGHLLRMIPSVWARFGSSRHTPMGRGAKLSRRARSFSLRAVAGPEGSLSKTLCSMRTSSVASFSLSPSSPNTVSATAVDSSGRQWRRFTKGACAPGGVVATTALLAFDTAFDIAFDGGAAFIFGGGAPGADFRRSGGGTGCGALAPPGCERGG